MSTDSDTDREDLPTVDRLLALSDGVVAIALTLLVLQLSVPVVTHANSASDLASALTKDRGDRLIAYVISFYVIAQFWLVHHRVFRMITGQREGLAWWNFAFLFTITIMPFTRDLLGKFSANPLAIDIFAANLLLATMATQLTVIYGSRKDLVTPETAQQTRAARYRVAGSVLVIAVSIVLAWVNPDAAKYCWLLLAVAPRLAERWSGRHAA
jgi:TMEM175 potassium channel family protein